MMNFYFDYIRIGAVNYQLFSVRIRLAVLVFLINHDLFCGIVYFIANKLQGNPECPN